MNNRRIFLAGDSTCQYNDNTTFPQKGWGQYLIEYLNDFTIINYAKNGRSTRSFISDGRLEQIEKEIKPGDYLFIQFGHNDQKDDPERGTEAFGSYSDFLKEFIQVAKKNSATPILLTSVSRRAFDGDGKLEDQIHSDYPDAMKQVAIDEGVSLIDIYENSREWLISLGDIESKNYFMIFPPNTYPTYPDGKEDNTHMVEAGAKTIAKFVADGFIKLRS